MAILQFKLRRPNSQVQLRLCLTISPVQPSTATGVIGKAQAHNTTHAAHNGEPCQRPPAVRPTNQATELLGQQQADLLQNLPCYCLWQGADELHRASLPIQTLDLICQNDASNE